MEVIQNFDWMVLHGIQGLHCRVLDSIMPLITLLGEHGILWVVLSVVLTVIPKTRKCGIAMMLGLLLELLIGNLVLKPMIARPRPYMLDPGITPIVPKLADFSFPSGHTYGATAAGVVLFRYYKKWGIVVFILTVLIGFSRLYLQMHFLTDVLGGVVFGFICAEISLFIVSHFSKKKSKST